MPHAAIVLLVLIGLGAVTVGAVRPGALADEQGNGPQPPPSCCNKTSALARILCLNFARARAPLPALPHTLCPAALTARMEWNLGDVVTAVNGAPAFLSHTLLTPPYNANVPVTGTPTNSLEQFREAMAYAGKMEINGAASFKFTLSKASPNPHTLPTPIPRTP